MKKKKIKLEDLKIQSFSTSHRLSKKDTDEIIGGTYWETCQSWNTDCFCGGTETNAYGGGDCCVGSIQSRCQCQSDTCPPPTNDTGCGSGDPNCNTDSVYCQTLPDYC